MPSKLEKSRKALTSARKRWKEESRLNMALTAASGYGAGYVTGRYPDKVFVGGANEDGTGEGAWNLFMIGGGLLAAGSAVTAKIPSAVGAAGLGALTGTLYGEGLVKGTEHR